jgi:hypothetical protein
VELPGIELGSGIALSCRYSHQTVRESTQNDAERPADTPAMLMASTRFSDDHQANVARKEGTEAQDGWRSDPPDRRPARCVVLH